MIEEAIKQFVRSEFEIVAEEFKHRITDLNKPMSKEETAEFLGVTVGTINNAMKHPTNPIPYGRVMSVPKFVPKEVWEWAKNRRKR